MRRPETSRSAGSFQRVAGWCEAINERRSNTFRELCTERRGNANPPSLSRLQRECPSQHRSISINVNIYESFDEIFDAVLDEVAIREDAMNQRWYRDDFALCQK